MPCTPDTACTTQTGNQNYTAGPNMAPSTDHFANMGWVGYVKLTSQKLDATHILRVTSADVNLSQDITMPDVIDGRIDRTVYQLGPKIVEGTLSMPLIADIPSPGVGQEITTPCPSPADLTEAGALLDNIWCWATSRGDHGRLYYDDTNLLIRYANHAAFTFDKTIVNTLSMTIAQSEAVSWDIAVIGNSRSPMHNPVPWTDPDALIEPFLSPARVMTWNDVTINGMGGCARENELFHSNQVREFNMEINNNADRFFSLNGSLFPIDINVGQREITGSLTLMGYQHRLREVAETNQDFFTEKNEIRMAFYIGDDTYDVGTQTFTPRDWIGTNPPVPAIFQKKLASVIFRIEEVSMTNDVLETTVNYLALANDQEGFEAVSPGSSCEFFPVWA